jgi:hypothetical protein
MELDFLAHLYSLACIIPKICSHRLNMELDFHWLRHRRDPPLPPAFVLKVIYEGAIGQSR